MGDTPIEVGARVTFPYGGSRRTGRVSDISLLPDGRGANVVSYLIDVGPRKVFVQGDGVALAAEGGTAAFDAVAEGVAYGRKKPRGNRR